MQTELGGHDTPQLQQEQLAWGWKTPPNGSSHPWQEGAGCWLAAWGPQFFSTWVSPQHGNWGVPRAKTLIEGGRSSRLCCDSSNSIISAIIFQLRQMQRPSQVQGEWNRLHQVTEKQQCTRRGAGQNETSWFLCKSHLQRWLSNLYLQAWRFWSQFHSSDCLLKLSPNQIHKALY